jgi:DNA-directed RNA polymerase subunit E'/Rpb7
MLIDQVTFRILVFRPFKGEIIQGTILYADLEGIRGKIQRRRLCYSSLDIVTLDFFDDIWIPKALLQPDSH